MKKLLSVLLAVLMLFSAVAMSASAASGVTNPSHAVELKNNYGASDSVVIRFHFNGGTSSETVPVFTGANFVWEKASGEYYWIPQNETQLLVDTTVYLPYAVHSDETKAFEGWYKADGTTVGTVGPYKISYADVDTTTGCIELYARYRATETEDTMGTIIDVLCKIFGALIGIVMYNGNTEAGVQMMKELLGGVLG